MMIDITYIVVQVNKKCIQQSLWKNAQLTKNIVLMKYVNPLDYFFLFNFLPILALRPTQIFPWPKINECNRTFIIFISMIKTWNQESALFP